MLRYEENEYYQTHHDYIPHQLQRQSGVRILTLYMYLNDVEEGGGTEFTNLGPLTVTPKKGAALIWPSVQDQSPHTKDERTMHAALPVKKGIKYGKLCFFVEENNLVIKAIAFLTCVYSNLVAGLFYKGANAWIHQVRFHALSSLVLL